MELDWIVLTGNPFDPAHESQKNLVYKLEHARRLALKGGYDYLFLHEHDIILPKEALKKLTSAKADLATGVYRLRRHHGAGSDLCLLTELRTPWTAFDRKTKFAIGYDERQLSDYKIKVYQKHRFYIAGSGLGCLLISRPVLLAVPFRWVPSSGTLDILYACAVQKKKFRYVCDGSVQCDHEDEDHVVYRIGERYWDSTLILSGGVWKEFSKVVPTKPVSSAKLHLGPHGEAAERQGWVISDLTQGTGVQPETVIDRLRPRLPFEDDFFSEIHVEDFAERILDKHMLISELWRVSKRNARIVLKVRNDRSDPRNLSIWPRDTFNHEGHRFAGIVRSFKNRRMVWNLRSLKGR